MVEKVAKKSGRKGHNFYLKMAQKLFSSVSSSPLQKIILSIRFRPKTYLRLPLFSTQPYLWFILILSSTVILEVSFVDYTFKVCCFQREVGLVVSN